MDVDSPPAPVPAAEAAPAAPAPDGQRTRDEKRQERSALFEAQRKKKTQRRPQTAESRRRVLTQHPAELKRAAVKVLLKTFVPDAGLRQRIEHRVQGVTNMRVHAFEVILRHVVEHARSVALGLGHVSVQLRADGDSWRLVLTPPAVPPLDQRFFEDALRCASSLPGQPERPERYKNPGLWATRDQVPVPPLPSRKGMGQLITEVAKQMATNSKHHVVRNLRRRVMAYFKVITSTEWLQHDQQLGAKWPNKLAWRACSCLLKNEAFSMPQKLPPPGQLRDAVDALEGVLAAAVAEQRTAHARMLPLNWRKQRSRWWRFLPWIYSIQTAVERWNEALRQRVVPLEAELRALRAQAGQPPPPARVGPRDVAVQRHKRKRANKRRRQREGAPQDNVPPPRAVRRWYQQGGAPLAGRRLQQAEGPAPAPVPAQPPQQPERQGLTEEERLLGAIQALTQRIRYFRRFLLPTFALMPTPDNIPIYIPISTSTLKDMVGWSAQERREKRKQAGSTNQAPAKRPAVEQATQVAAGGTGGGSSPATVGPGKRGRKRGRAPPSAAGSGSAPKQHQRPAVRERADGSAPAAAAGPSRGGGSRGGRGGRQEQQKRREITPQERIANEEKRVARVLQKIEGSDAVWRQHCNVPMMETANRAFAFFVTTDGYGAYVHVLRRRSAADENAVQLLPRSQRLLLERQRGRLAALQQARELVGPPPQQQQQQQQQQQPAAGLAAADDDQQAPAEAANPPQQPANWQRPPLVIAADPGNKLMYALVKDRAGGHPDSHATHDASRRSSESVSVACKHGLRQRWLEHKLARAPGCFQARQSALPSAKTADPAQLWERGVQLTGLFGLMGQALEVYGSRKSRNWRFQVERLWQREAVGIILEVTEGLDRDSVVVGWGSAAVGRGAISRYGLTASKPFLRRLCCFAQLIMVSEYRTSQVCSFCDTRTLQAVAVRGTHPHALRECTECHAVWDRDCNAARNMLKKTWWMLKDEDFPEVYGRHAGQAAADSGADTDSEPSDGGMETDTDSGADSGEPSDGGMDSDEDWL